MTQTHAVFGKDRYNRGQHNMSQETEEAFNRIGTSFQAPIPGQSLTDDPETPRPFEQPPQYTTVEEALEHYFEMMTQENIYEGILQALLDDVSIMEIVKPLLFQGFQEGLFNPDMMLLLAEPLTYMIAALAEQADVDFTIMGDPDEYPETERDQLPEMNAALKKVDGSEEPENFPEEISEKLKNVTPPQRSLLGER
jgi:hypothetical protein